MLEYSDYCLEKQDSCEIFAKQVAFVSALALDNACMQVGK